jgi:hypothetical protein
MAFPPEWDLRPRDGFLTHQADYARERPRGLEVTMEFDRLVAGRVQIHTAGSELLRVHVDAEILLGSKFSGKFSHLPYAYDIDFYACATGTVLRLYIRYRTPSVLMIPYSAPTPGTVPRLRLRYPNLPLRPVPCPA